jgi:addiction module HigA family antidote
MSAMALEQTGPSLRLLDGGMLQLTRCWQCTGEFVAPGTICKKTTFVQPASRRHEGRLSLIGWERSMITRGCELDGIDLPDIDTGKRIPPVHPGEILRTEFLDPLGKSVNALALALHVPAPRINDVVLGKRAVSADTALRLERYFGVSAQFWLNLQIGYDLSVANEGAGEQIAREIEPLPKRQRPKLPKAPRSHARAAALAASVAGGAAAVKRRRKL